MKLGGVALTRVAEEVDRWKLPELAVDTPAALTVTAVVTAPGKTVAKAIFQVESFGEVAASAEVEAQVTADPLTVELGGVGCNCTSGGGSPLWLFALAAVALGARRRYARSRRANHAL